MTDNPAGETPFQVVQQRVRNRLIENLEWVSSYEEQRSYQEAVPMICVCSEAFNAWGDYVREGWEGWLHEPVFSSEEIRQIARHDAVLESSDLPWDAELEDVIGTDEWEKVRQSAEIALAAFNRRGRFSEETAFDFATTVDVDKSA